MKKDIKLYNALFPLWFIIYLFPTSLFIAIPGNFIIDSIVLIIAMAVLKIEDRQKFYKSTILKVFGLGFAADFIGALLMICAMCMGVGSMGDEPYLTIPALIIVAILIFVFDYKISFKNCEERQRKILSLIFAIVTAPYTFLIPSSLIYGY